MKLGVYTIDSTPMEGYRILVVAENSCLSLINEIVTEAIVQSPGLIKKIRRHEVRGYFEPDDFEKFDFVFMSKQKLPEVPKESRINNCSVYIAEADENTNILGRSRLAKEITQKLKKAC